MRYVSWWSERVHEIAIFAISNRDSDVERSEAMRLTLPHADCGLSISSPLNFTALPSSSISALPQTQLAHAFLLVAQLSAAASCSQSQKGQEWVG